MKLPFSSYDLRFGICRKSAVTVAANRQSAIGNRQSGQQGIALVVTLIMLAVTLVMAVAFLALARRERGSVTTTTDTTTARLATDSAVSAAQAQIAAGILAGLTNGISGSAYNGGLIVSTNYINPAGFNGSLNYVNPTNVSYVYPGGGLLSAADFEQNVANLFYLPRPPVLVSSNEPLGRFYLDLNENGRYDPFAMVPQIGPGGGYLHPDGTEDNNPQNVITNMAPGGDPEWIGVLAHPDAPCSANNPFIARYAFIALPMGNSLDLNYIHNEVWNPSLSTSDGFMRNQGVGAWEINLAAFLADLNTNLWGRVVGSGADAPSGSASYYQYNEPDRPNSGTAFNDARALLSYRYGLNLAPFINSLPTAGSALFNSPFTFPSDGIDDYGDGPLQITLNTNEDWLAPGADGDLNPKKALWPGADSTNHFFTVDDLFDLNKTAVGVPQALKNVGNDFTAHMKLAGNSVDTYDRYTYYRMLDQLGFDSTPDEGKLDLNYSNAVVTYANVNGVALPRSISVIPNAETNLVRWSPTNFFIAAADKLLRTYTAEWFQANPTNYLFTYYGRIPRGYVGASGLGVTNVQYFGQVNQIPAFGITNIPVWVSNRFVYTPAVNRLLQLAANLYDATTNGPVVGNTALDFPHVYRPIFEKVNTYGDIYIVGYVPVTTIASVLDPQLAPPHSIEELATGRIQVNPQSLYAPLNMPIEDGQGPVNVYGVPWVVGAKKGLPNFNQMSMITAAQVTRKLEVTRPSVRAPLSAYHTNQMYVFGISNSLAFSFWNSYNTNYPDRVRVYVTDALNMAVTNNDHGSYGYWPGYTNYLRGAIIPSWPGSQWSTRGLTSPNPNSFFNVNWGFNFLNPSVYRYNGNYFDPVGSPTSYGFEITPQSLPQLPSFGLAFTNYVQAFILDGNNVIDYVQLEAPVTMGNLNQALTDPIYPDRTGTFYQWSTNAYTGSAPPNDIPYGAINQLWVSGHPGNAPVSGGRWSTAPTPMGTTPQAEAAYYEGFFVPSFQYNGQIYVNNQLSIQAPYTPSRTAYSAVLLQANDPLVHYMASDLNAEPGAWAVWAGKAVQVRNGYWYQSDDPIYQPLPTPPLNPIGGRYQPWMQHGQMDGMANVIPVTNNYAVKDPLVRIPDNWDFPTNLYPAVGWIGRVHRGTPWQTVYLKDADMLKASGTVGRTPNYIGTNTWAQWSGDIQQDYFGEFYDAANAAPEQDRLLFDVFTARPNDNAAQGTLPVNQTHLAAWSAVFGGMVALSNSAPRVLFGSPLTYTNQVVNPAGPMNPSVVWSSQPPIWQIVNGPYGINVTRATTNLFPQQTFEHAGDILATPALSGQSPFLNRGSTTVGYQQKNYGINDELYEWLPQHMMGLVRMSDPRYVVYAYGQTLKPAPNGEVLSGNLFQLVTNYQVTAESAVRAVIRVDGASTSHPHAVIESETPLPPN